MTSITIQVAAVRQDNLKNCNVSFTRPVLIKKWGDRCRRCLTAEGSEGIDVSSQLSGHTQRLLGLQVGLTVQKTNAGRDREKKERMTHSLTHSPIELSRLKVDQAEVIAGGEQQQVGLAK